MIRHAFCFLLLFIFIPRFGESQTIKNLPQDYFVNPLDIDLKLSGTFGELRSNHFHSGLDIKTNQRTGAKVYASASGYVSRIKIERYGYGKVVAAHTEFSRMLAEHGLLGLFSLSLLIGIPIYYFISNESPKSKLIKIVFGTLALLTMLHSAMRIAMPCFAYGLLFPKYYDE